MAARPGVFFEQPDPFGTLSAYNASPVDLTASGEFDLPESGDIHVSLLVGG